MSRLTNFGDGFGVNLSTEAHGLGAEEIHHFGPSDAVGESGAAAIKLFVSLVKGESAGCGVQVLDVGGGGELSSGGESIGEHSLSRAQRVRKRLPS